VVVEKMVSYVGLFIADHTVNTPPLLQMTSAHEKFNEKKARSNFSPPTIRERGEVIRPKLSTTHDIAPLEPWLLIIQSYYHALPSLKGCSRCPLNNHDRDVGLSGTNGHRLFKSFSSSLE
jgi:hypothetical protein